mgnify:CR=1 FL=1
MAIQGELVRSLGKRPITWRYPIEDKGAAHMPPGFRGRVKWDPAKCVGCGICVRDCPSGALEMIGKGPTAEIRYHVARCMFCSQCVESCPRGALEMTQEFELADYTPPVIEFKRK